MEITAAMVKELRQATGAGILDCRKALETASGDLNRAAAILREKGLAAAAKKAERAAHEGTIGSYIHTGNKVAALVELNCETDFVARTEEFQALARDLAMQVVALHPKWVRSEEVPADVTRKAQEDFRAEIGETDKSPEVVEKIVQGKLAKFYEENCLLEQSFIRDENRRIKDLLTGAIARLGENIVVRGISRMEVGG